MLGEVVVTKFVCRELAILLPLQVVAHIDVFERYKSELTLYGKIENRRTVCPAVYLPYKLRQVWGRLSALFS
jgi:hypothetical protein